MATRNVMQRPADRLLALAKLLQSEIHEEAALPTIVILAEVARKAEGIGMQDLMAATGHSSSTVSRNVELLGSGSISRRGAGLVETFDDPEYRKRKMVRLTARGRVVLDKITAHFI